MSGAYAIGVDLGGTRIKLVAVTAEGEELLRRIEPTDDDEAAVWAERVRDVIAAAAATLGSAPYWIGVAAPGLVARDGRSIAWMQGRMEQLQGLDWTEHLGHARAVPVINDAHAALIGEAWRGAAAGRQDVVLLTLGTGVGGGILVGGRLLRGQIGRAGHLGHISLDPDGAPDIARTPGSLEDAIGDWTLQARSEGRFDSTERLVEAYRAGDPEAARIWLRSVQVLAAGLASLINTLDPEVVVLGGGISRAGPALFEPLAGFMDRYEWRPTGEAVPVVPATLGSFAGALGAARYAVTGETE